jgi:short-subunit dehydrogenase
MPTAATQTLTGQTALITGASRGIGEAIARKLAALGANLLLTGRDTTRLATLQAELLILHPTAAIQFLAGDITQPAFCQDLVERALTSFGQLDILINNAGIGGKIALLTEVPNEQITAMIATNLTAPLLMMKYALPPMVARQSGSIITINSVAGKTAFPYWAVYDATKAGLKAATEAVAQEQQSNNIRVMSIFPGATATAIWDSLDLAAADRPDDSGMMSPFVVADAVVFALCQPPHVYIGDITLSPTRPAL